MFRKDLIISLFNCHDLSGKSEIGEIDDIAISAAAQQAVLRLDISMYVLLGMQSLKPLEELIDKHERCLERKLAIAKHEKILEAGS